jgi:hypothetical protein
LPLFSAKKFGKIPDFECGFRSAGSSTSGGRMSGLRRIDSVGERTHRQLIDCIRSKDTDALVEAIENGSSSIDYMDDVGQVTLRSNSSFRSKKFFGHFFTLQLYLLGNYEQNLSVSNIEMI